MARTIKNWLDGQRHIMNEKGLQWLWNEWSQLANSIVGAGVVAGTTQFGAIDMTIEAGVKSGAAGTFSGSFGSANAAAGSKQLRGDPAGASGGLVTDTFGTPVPPRQTNRTVGGGFRT